jgi:signal peptide peptidase SppA
MINAASWVLSHRWAILPEMLETIISVANREASITELRDAFAVKDAEPLPGARRAEIRDGIAIIPVFGPIFPRANLFTWMSGATSIQTLAKDLAVAVNDRAVGGIVLNIDSPGGEVTGVNEFAAMVKAARGVKPITAYVLGYAASAGYWIASAAGKVVADATAELGSIGVVAGYQDTRGKDEKAGVKNIEIVSSISPNKRPDLSTDEGRAQIQKIVDDLADVFVRAVADNRGVPVGKVLSDFGQGGTLVGENAVRAGLADSLGSFESVMSQMKEDIYIRSTFYPGRLV